MSDIINAIPAAAQEFVSLFTAMYDADILLIAVPFVVLDLLFLAYRMVIDRESRS